VRVRDIETQTPWSAVIRLALQGRPAFRFKPGQAARLSGPSGRTTTLSIASSPDQAAREGTIEFLMGTRSGGALVPGPAGLDIGQTLSMEGPFGTFGLPEPLGHRRLLFIAGGTGIAPLRPMIHSALDRRHPPAITLLYSAQSSDGFAFVKEFKRISRAGRLHLLLTATRDARAGWRGRRGRIQTSWLRRLLRDGPTVCLVCGPAAFVESIAGELKRLGVPPALIRFEQG
jgi:NAD(P)H-flavin reductase